VVHQASEPHLFIFYGYLPYPLQRTLHDGPILGPVRVLLSRFPLASPLRSTRSAIGSAALAAVAPTLFARFVATMGLSDFLCPFIIAVCP